MNTFFSNQYCCQNNSKGESDPFAVFTEQSFFNFMSTYLGSKIDSDDVTYSTDSESILKFYITEWSKTKISDDAYNQFVTSDSYNMMIQKINEAKGLFI